MTDNSRIYQQFLEVAWVLESPVYGPNSKHVQKSSTGVVVVNLDGFFSKQIHLSSSDTIRYTFEGSSGAQVHLSDSNVISQSHILAGFNSRQIQKSITGRTSVGIITTEEYGALGSYPIGFLALGQANVDTSTETTIIDLAGEHNKNIQVSSSDNLI